MATESNQAVLFEGLFEQAKLYRAQRDALLAAAEAVSTYFPPAERINVAATRQMVEALRAAVQAAKGGA